MRHRLLVASSLLLLLALTLIALPAAGKPPLAPTGTATATFENNGNCSVTVTYTWSGFRGSNLTAEYAVVSPIGGGALWGMPIWVYPVSGSGTASHTFQITREGLSTYYGRGRVFDAKGRELSGSSVSSPTSADLDCGP